MPPDPKRKKNPVTQTDHVRRNITKHTSEREPKKQNSRSQESNNITHSAHVREHKKATSYITKMKDSMVCKKPTAPTPLPLQPISKDCACNHDLSIDTFIQMVYYLRDKEFNYLIEKSNEAGLSSDDRSEILQNAYEIKKNGREKFFDLGPDDEYLKEVAVGRNKFEYTQDKKKSFMGPLKEPPKEGWDFFNRYLALYSTDELDVNFDNSAYAYRLRQRLHLSEALNEIGKFVDQMNTTFRKYGIDNCLKKIHFLAQSYLETERFRRSMEKKPSSTVRGGRRL